MRENESNKKVSKTLINILILVSLLSFVGIVNFYQYTTFKNDVIDSKEQIPLVKDLSNGFDEIVVAEIPKEVTDLKNIIETMNITPNIPEVYMGKNDPFKQLLPLKQDVSVVVGTDYIEKEKDFVEWLGFLTIGEDEINDRVVRILYENLTELSWSDLIQSYIENEVQFKEQDVSQEGEVVDLDKYVYLDSFDIYEVFNSISEEYNLNFFLDYLSENMYTINLIETTDLFKIFYDSNLTLWAVFEIDGQENFFTIDDIVLDKYKIETIDYSRARVILIDENNNEYTIYVKKKNDYVFK